MDMDKVKDDVVKLVEEILSKKAIAGIEADVEEALKAAEKLVSDLTDRVAAVEARAASDAAMLESLESSKKELESELAAKNEEVASLSAEKEALFQRVEAAETTLENMEKDKLTADRMAELEGLKIARAGESKDKQVQLVREMSDEDFVAYKAEMVTLREELAASIKSELEAASSAHATVEVIVNDEGVAADMQTPPADIDGALESASVTLPNADTSSTGSKWTDFGPRLAKYMEESRSEASKGMKR